MKSIKWSYSNTLAAVALAAALSALSLSVIAAPPGGPGPGGRMGMGQRVVMGALASLDLTQEQKDKVKAVVSAERSGMEAMAAQHRADELALRDLASSATPDPKAVGETFLRVRQNREAMKARRDAALAKIEAVLNPAQKAKFEGYIQAAKDGGKAARRRFARGGPPAGI